MAPAPLKSFEDDPSPPPAMTEAGANPGCRADSTLHPARLASSEIGAGRSVLVLDDQHDIGELVCEFAAELGYACAATTDPAAFVRAANALKPTALVLDLQMPGLDGVQVLRELAAERCESRVLIVSGAEPTIIDAAMQLGAALGLRMLGCVRKPLIIPGLQVLLSAMCLRAESSAGEEARRPSL